MNAGMKCANGKASFVLTVTELKRGGHCVDIANANANDNAETFAAVTCMIEANSAMKALGVDALTRFANLIGIAKDAGFWCVESW